MASRRSSASTRRAPSSAVDRVAWLEPRWWTIKIPPGYTDVTATTKVQEDFATVLQKRRDFGAVIELTTYRSDRGVVMVMDTSFEVLAFNREHLEAFEERDRSAAPDFWYQRVETEHLVIGTQRHSFPSGKLGITKRWTGIATDKSTKSLSIACMGPEDSCHPILASVVIDESQFRPHERPKSVTGTDIGEMFALGLFGIGILGALIVVLRKRRRPTTA